MTPAARVQAAIEVLDRTLAGQAAEQALTGWARASRFAGSGDRAAVRDHVFAALRCLRSYTARAGALAPSGRALMIGALRDLGRAPDEVFTGVSHAPAPLSPAETQALAAAPALQDLPAAVRADCPDWLCAPLERALGADWEAAMQAQRARAPVFLRVNLARTTRPQAQSSLAFEGVVTRPSDLAETALEVLENANKIKPSQTYLQGLVELQDASSQAAVLSLTVQDGGSVLDYCAGGGGKTLALAARMRGRFVAHDAAPERMRDLPERAARAGVKVALAKPGGLSDRKFDLVLVDAPCSGSGTWRRTPDAKWRLTPERLSELVALQRRILSQAQVHVRPGGRLAYMTCSLLTEENEDQVDAFLGTHADFSCVQTRRFSPVSGGDGFFVAEFLRA